LARLRKPQTDEEKEIFENLPAEVKTQIKAKSSMVLLPLNQDMVMAIFGKKQDYEPFAISSIWPVLQDLEIKAELKMMDLAIARTCQQAVLLVTTGYQDKEGKPVVSPKSIQALQQIFANESVGRVLVHDFSTKVQFVLPQIGDILDPKKYQIVNEDIKTGLNYVLTGTDQKFSNQYIQVQLFIQRLQQARELFLNKFLIPEIKRISALLKFKNIPVPYFEDIDLRYTQTFETLIGQLYQYGLLAPSEALTAIETGRLPDKEESEVEQENFRTLKDKGYYEPITGSGFTQKTLMDKTNKQQTKMQESQLEHDNKQKTKELKHKAENPDPAPVNVIAPILKQQKGRPSGKSTPNSKKRKSSPMKASINDNDQEIEEIEEYSLSKIKDNIILAMELDKEIEKSLLEKHNLKELNEEQVKIKNEIQELIIANQEPEKWKESVNRYIESPINDNGARLEEIDKISYNHQISQYLASILISSKK